MLVAIAWRNLWRNPRRTLITVAAVAGGLASMLAMYAMVRAMGDRLLEGMTGSMGHVQIHREGYGTGRSSSRTVDDAELVLAAARGTEGVAEAAGRVFGFAHASIVRGSDEEIRLGGGQDVASPVVSLLGVDPEAEGRVTDLPRRVVEGRWLEGGAEVVVGAGLARRHGIALGDALLPTAVDTSGAMRGPWAVSDRPPRVVGVLRSGVEALDGRMVLLPRVYLAELLRMEDRVHEVAVRASDPERLDPLVGAIETSLARARAEVAGSLAVLASSPLVVTRAARPEHDPEVADRRATARLVAAEPAPASDGGREGRTEGLEGRFLERSEDLVLSRQLASTLGVSPGDRVTVAVPVDCGEDVAEEDCPPAAEPFVVAGVAEESRLVGGRFALVSNAVLADNVAALAPTAVAPLEGEDRRLAAALGARLRGAGRAPDEVRPWYAIAPDLQQMLQMMDVAPLIFFMIIYFAVALGIVNTMLMATFERTREIGLVRALGMRPGPVVAMVLWESTLLAAVGIAGGLALGLPLVWYWASHGMNLGVFMGEETSFDISGVAFDPVLWPSLGPADVLRSVLAVGLMTAAAGLWPAVRAARLRPTEALRHE